MTASASTLEAPAATQIAADRDCRNFIAGQWVETGRLFENRNPIDNSLVGQVHEAGRAEVDAAVTAARKALRGPWGKLTLDERCALLHKVADEMMRRHADFVAAELADTGMPLAFASNVNVPRGAANFKVFADLFRNVPTEAFAQDVHHGGKAINYSLRSPRGVIAVVCPWNLPLLLMTWKVGPALACGNTVVVKPSEETPSTATLLGEVMRDVGVPEGVYNVVHGFGPDSAGAFLTEHPGVDGITFTGETGTGEAIMRAAAKGVRPVSFELGGKNPGIVFADADLDAAIEGITRSTFQNTGQVCLGTERVYVERPIFDAFVARLKASAEALVMGPPDRTGVTMGPLISQEHRRKVLGYYEKAKAEGATIVTGGGVPAMGDALDEGSWVEPTIWTGLPDSSAMLREEVFGPCCHIAPFDTIDEVIGRSNATAYGLAATVWTQNLSTAHRMGAELEVGICWINSWFLRDLRTAFGGAKQSGIGREGGVHSLEFYTELKNVCIKL
ncbi:2-hydroxymuconic semialdehyde dehydrogenase [Sphingomonas oryzagri]|uniref:2-hydroxymuconic semialdehyde dehydrogenase n=1 Tax=Sphingomonas oryzagri TaxID=3042314 RepID=A0ABT6N7C2_9SPHN|nr:2-hydroxymuconic semialdehyde dehydrogenase [Sphingomonas oryzagri]MDH7640995.1 2-hydroxymuconic semialdehyde dehydrogenase [Sphingomonas oryzagri]